MSTQTDNPIIKIASFHDDGTKSYLRARTEDGIELSFEIDPMALAIMGLTLDSALRPARDRLRAMEGGPTTPTAPDSPEGLEG